MVLEESQHFVLGHWLYLWVDARGGREEVPRYCDQGKRFRTRFKRILRNISTGLTRTLRAEKRQGQQGHHRFQHHVHRGPVPQVPEGALEVPQDRGQQAV